VRAPTHKAASRCFRLYVRISAPDSVLRIVEPQSRHKGAPQLTQKQEGGGNINRKKERV